MAGVVTEMKVHWFGESPGCFSSNPSRVEFPGQTSECCLHSVHIFVSHLKPVSSEQESVVLTDYRIPIENITSASGKKRSSPEGEEVDDREGDEIF